MSLALEPAFTIVATLAAPIDAGSTPFGRRRVIPITGGTVRGPLLDGEVLPGGADWNVVRPDGAVHVWARYDLRAADGTIVSVINEGLGTASPAGWYCPTRPTFEVATDSALAWLNTTTFLGQLLPPNPEAPLAATIDIYRVTVAA